jgi:uncharacterized protein (TIGR00304 family)
MRREIGSLLIALGVLLAIISLAQDSGKQAGYGGVILVGPLPIVFGSSPELALGAATMAAILMALSLLFLRRQI